MSANSFKADIFVRIHFPDHGITTQEQGLKMITHEDGTQVGISREEWQKMTPPLLVKHKGSSHWTFSGSPVELKAVASPRSHRKGG